MPHSGDGHNDRALVIRTIELVERRTRRTRQIRDLLLGLSAVAAIFVLLTLWNLLVPLPEPARRIGHLLALVVAAVALGRAWSRREPLARAAADVDRRAALKDELITAHWFAATGESSGWIDLQIRRAAATADRLDIARLYPLAVSRDRWLPALGLVVLLVLLNLVPVGLTRGWLEASPVPVALTAAERAKLEALRQALLEHALADPERERRLVEILARLEEGDLTEAEVIELLAEARELLDAESRDRLEAARQETGEEVPPDGSTGEQSQEPSERATADGEETRTTDRRQQPRGEDAAPQEILDEASRELGQLEEAFSDRRQQARDERQAAQQSPSQSASQSPEEAADAASMPGGERSRTEQGSEAASRQRSQDGQGDMTGGSQDAGSEYGAPREVEVTLREEILSSELAIETPPTGERIERDTTAGRSVVEYRDVEGRTPYAPADRMEADQIPWPYRDLVRNYFRALGPGSPR